MPERYMRPLDEARTTLRITSGKLRRAISPPRRPDGELNLHVGCGAVDHPRFVNVDGLPYPHVHYVRAIDDLSPIESDTASLLYACHCLEHFPMAELPRILGEWRRVLRPGGILRLSVPDFDKLVAIYQRHGRDLTTISRVLLGGQDSRYNFHHSVYNRRSLTELFERLGMRDVREWAPGSSDLTSFDDWSGRLVPIGDEMCSISLNLEAVK